MVVDPSTSIRPHVGIGSLNAPARIGTVTIQHGSGSPSAAYNALQIGDLYIDTTNGALYIATATGSGSWQQYTAATATLASGTTIGGTSVITGSGDPNGTATAVRIGDLYVDYTNNMIWIASATGTSSWYCAAMSGQCIYAAMKTGITTTQVNAGYTILTGITGVTIVPVKCEVFQTAATSGGTSIAVQDTNSSPVAILTATEAALAASLVVSSSAPASGVTLGAGLFSAITAGKGIAIKGTGTIVNTGTWTVVVKYMISA